MYLGAMHELPCQAYVLHAAGTQQGLHEDLQRGVFKPIKKKEKKGLNCPVEGTVAAPLL